ncbi:MAG: DUF1345 domain-containing protein [Ferruginibacter sp.]|nr:DUF1345 domain-containing protein [Rhodoferax sp.]
MNRLHRLFIFRQIHIRPRLFASGLVGILATLVLTGVPGLQTVTRLVIGWNVFSGLYLLLAVHMMVQADHDKMRMRARQQDEGRRTVLAMVVLAALATLGAIIAELAAVKDMVGTERYAHIALAVLTIATSWAFTHVMFALHYAHDFYFNRVNKQPAGLEFPGTEQPDYGDFIYFAFIIGTSGQTADVSLTTSAMRRTGIVHCVLAFFFNTTLVALTINIASGLF